jgi:4a-hydroxytetrahydrobiopterin dehydratase
MTNSCDLSQKKCVPCEGGLEPLSITDAKNLLKDVTGWALANGGTAIKRRFEFRDFKAALSFVNKVGEVAEAEGHHPDINLGWGYADILLWTHAINGLHENDFIVASKINALKPQF